MASLVYNNLPFDQNDYNDVDRNVILGRFMTAWGQVEATCGFLFREILDLDYSQSFFVFETITTQHQLEIMKGLLEDNLETPHYEKLRDIVARVGLVSAKRNKIIHAGWGQYNGEVARFYRGITRKQSDEICSETQRGKNLKTTHIHTLTEIEAASSEALQVYQELSAAMHEAKLKSPLRKELDEARHDLRMLRRQRANERFARAMEVISRPKEQPS